MDLYTVAKFHEGMKKFGEAIYSMKMTKTKLQHQYGEGVRFVDRHGKSNIILLENVSHILTENWYEEHLSNTSDEVESIIKTAVKLLKNVIKTHPHETAHYPTNKDIIDASSDSVPDLLKVFIVELFTEPLKQSSISQAIFAATRPRSLMPLQVGLAISTDNKLASKWLNTQLHKLGFAVGYDKFIQYKQNILKHDTTEDVVRPNNTTLLQ